MRPTKTRKDPPWRTHCTTPAATTPTPPATSADSRPTPASSTSRPNRSPPGLPTPSVTASQRKVVDPGEVGGGPRGRGSFLIGETGLDRVSGAEGRDPRAPGPRLVAERQY